MRASKACMMQCGCPQGWYLGTPNNKEVSKQETARFPSLKAKKTFEMNGLRLSKFLHFLVYLERLRVAFLEVAFFGQRRYGITEGL